MAVQLKCAWCGAQLADGGVSFFLFSCGDLACALHVMNPFCVSHDNYSLVAEVDSDAICIELLSSMNRLWQSQRSNWVGFAPAIYEKLEGMLKDYLNSLALECRQAMNLSEVYATPTVSKQCTLCSADISNEPQICQHCATRALVPQKSDSACRCTDCYSYMNLEELICKDCHSAATLHQIAEAIQSKQCVCIQCGKANDSTEYFCFDCEKAQRCSIENEPVFEVQTCSQCLQTVTERCALCSDCYKAEIESYSKPCAVCPFCQSPLQSEFDNCTNCGLNPLEVLKNHEGDMNQREAVLSEREKRMAEREQALTERDIDINTRDFDVSTRESELDKQMQQITVRNSDFTTRESELKSREAQLVKRKAEIEAKMENIMCQDCSKDTPSNQVFCELCANGRIESHMQTTSCLTCKKPLEGEEFVCTTCHHTETEKLSAAPKCQHCPNTVTKQELLCRSCSWKDCLTQSPQQKCQSCQVAIKDCYCPECFGSRVVRPPNKCSKCTKQSLAEEFVCEQCRVKESQQCGKCYLITDAKQLICATCSNSERSDLGHQQLVQVPSPDEPPIYEAAGKQLSSTRKQLVSGKLQQVDISQKVWVPRKQGENTPSKIGRKDESSPDKQSAAQTLKPCTQCRTTVVDGELCQKCKDEKRRQNISGSPSLPVGTQPPQAFSRKDTEQCVHCRGYFLPSESICFFCSQKRQPQERNSDSLRPKHTPFSPPHPYSGGMQTPQNCDKCKTEHPRSDWCTPPIPNQGAGDSQSYRSYPLNQGNISPACQGRGKTNQVAGSPSKSRPAQTRK